VPNTKELRSSSPKPEYEASNEKMNFNVNHIKKRNQTAHLKELAITKAASHHQEKNGRLSKARESLAHSHALSLSKDDYGIFERKGLGQRGSVMGFGNSK